MITCGTPEGRQGQWQRCRLPGDRLREQGGTQHTAHKDTGSPGGAWIRTHRSWHCCDGASCFDPRPGERTAASPVWYPQHATAAAGRAWSRHAHARGRRPTRRRRASCMRRVPGCTCLISASACFFFTCMLCWGRGEAGSVHDFVPQVRRGLRRGGHKGVCGCARARVRVRAGGAGGTCDDRWRAVLSVGSANCGGVAWQCVGRRGTAGPVGRLRGGGTMPWPDGDSAHTPQDRVK